MNWPLEKIACSADLHVPRDEQYEAIRSPAAYRCEVSDG